MRNSTRHSVSIFYRCIIADFPVREDLRVPPSGNPPVALSSVSGHIITYQGDMPAIGLIADDTNQIPRWVSASGGSPLQMLPLPSFPLGILRRELSTCSPVRKWRIRLHLPEGATSTKFISNYPSWEDWPLGTDLLIHARGIASMYSDVCFLPSEFYSLLHTDLRAYFGSFISQCFVFRCYWKWHF